MSSASILIVDDEPMMQTLMKTLLSPYYEIEITASGALALEMVCSGIKPDLILLDVLMPEMDGYVTLRQLKDNPSTNNIPVIFVSGMETEEDQSNGLALGAIDYVTKPIIPDILKSKVSFHLNQ